MGEPGGWDDPEWRTSTVRPDAESLRGLAHPLRLRLLGLLRLEGPSTASKLAAEVGESSGSTSYHLRQLAKHGFVVETEGPGSRRERWWRAAHRQTSWPSGPSWPPAWQDAAGASDYLVHLTPERTRALFAELEAVVERHRAAAEDQHTTERTTGHTTDAEQDVRPVMLFVRAVPYAARRGERS